MPHPALGSRPRRLFLLLMPLIAACLFGSATASAGEAGHGRMYGGGEAVDPATLPPGILRTTIEGLPAAARARAVAVLSGMTFHANDVASLRVDGTGGVLYACAA